MRWPSMDVFERELRLPPGVRARLLARAHVPDVIAALRAWHPDLEIAEDCAILTETYYDEEVALAGEEHAVEERPVFTLLLTEGDRLAGYVAVEYQASERALLGVMSAVDPRLRGRGLGRALLDASILVARSVGADMCYGFTELDNRAQCIALEKVGFVLCGILPDSDRAHVPGLGTRFVPEAIYVKTLVPREDWIWPEPGAMLPGPAVLMKLLFDFGEAPVPLQPFAQGPPPPQLDPAVAALLRARPAGTWPDIDLLAGQLSLPPGVTLHQVARSDIPQLISRLPDWFPQLVGGNLGHLLTATYYEEFMALAGEDTRIEQRPGYGMVCRYGGEIVTFAHMTCDLARSTLRGELEVIDPRHRGLGISSGLTPSWVLMGRALEIETLFGWATLRHPYAQHIAERSGMRVVGLTPAADRFAIAPAVVKHAFEAVYALSLVPAELGHRPTPDTMLPHVAALARLVLGEPEGAAR